MKVPNDLIFVLNEIPQRNKTAAGKALLHIRPCTRLKLVRGDKKKTCAFPMLKSDAGSRQSHLGSHVHPRWDPAFFCRDPSWDPDRDYETSQVGSHIWSQVGLKRPSHLGRQAGSVPFLPGSHMLLLVLACMNSDMPTRILAAVRISVISNNISSVPLFSTYWINNFNY